MVSLLSATTWPFQIALGIDLNGDRDVSEATRSERNEDEWLGNDPRDADAGIAWDEGRLLLVRLALLLRSARAEHGFVGERFDCGSKLGYLKATVAYGLDHADTGAGFRRHLEALVGGQI